MDRLESIALLEETHQFPGPYMFKAIGKSEAGFALRILDAVRAGLEEDVELPYHLRETAHGRHISVTLEPMIESAPQVLDIYRRIREVPGLVMVW